MTSENINTLADITIVLVAVVLAIIFMAHIVRFANRSTSRDLVYPPPDDKWYTGGPRYVGYHGPDGRPDVAHEEAHDEGYDSWQLSEDSEPAPEPSPAVGHPPGPCPASPARPRIPRYTRAVVTRGHYSGERVYVLSRVPSHPDEWFVRMTGGESTVLHETWFRLEAAQADRATSRS